MDTYKIIKREDYNPYGEVINTVFYIKQLKKGLLGKRWKYIEHFVGGWGDNYKVKTEFKS